MRRCHAFCPRRRPPSQVDALPPRHPASGRVLILTESCATKIGKMGVPPVWWRAGCRGVDQEGRGTTSNGLVGRELGEWNNPGGVPAYSHSGAAEPMRRARAHWQRASAASGEAAGGVGVSFLQPARRAPPLFKPLHCSFKPLKRLFGARKRLGVAGMGAAAPPGARSALRADALEWVPSARTPVFAAPSTGGTGAEADGEFLLQAPREVGAPK
jgi:hypothetical protein